MCHFLRNRTPCHLVPPRLPMAPSRPCLGGARAPFLGPDWGPFFGAGFWPQFWGPKSLHTQCVQPVRPPKLGPVSGPKKRTPFSCPWTALAAGNGAGAGFAPGGGGPRCQRWGAFSLRGWPPNRAWCSRRGEASPAAAVTARGAGGTGLPGGAASTLSGGSAASLGGPSQAWSEPPPRVTEAREQTVATGTLQCRRRARDCAKPEKREPPG